MLKWLKKSTTSLKGKLLNLGVAYLGLMIWLKLITSFYSWLFEKSYSFGQLFPFFNSYKRPELVDFFYYCLAAPLFEEIVFRKFPLDVIKSTKKDDLIIPTILFTSVIFGLVHGDSDRVLVQGVGGFILSILYIKNGYSYWSVICLHALWNSTLLYGIIKL